MMKYKHILKQICNKINSATYLYFAVRLYSGYFSISKYKKLKKDLKLFKHQKEQSKIDFPVKSYYPYYEDASDKAGTTKGAYFYQDLHIAQRIFSNKPKRHMDIGSRIDGFVTHVASFREIEILDIRPIENQVSNICFIQSDLMNEDPKLFECTDSISCLHALEHFGLGRYGDPICFEGHLIGFNNISKMLKQRGKFYFSVPMGEQRVEFHGQRVFSLKYLLELISLYYQIDFFSYVDDLGNFHENIELTTTLIQNNCSCYYGCAIFELTKK